MALTFSVTGCGGKCGSVFSCLFSVFSATIVRVWLVALPLAYASEPLKPPRDVSPPNTAPAPISGVAWAPAYKTPEARPAKDIINSVIISSNYVSLL